METLNRSHHPLMSSAPLTHNTYQHQDHHRSDIRHPPLHPQPQHSHSHAAPRQQQPPSPLDIHQPQSPQSHSMSPVSSPTSSFHAGQHTKRRRVPMEERKRTAMSCDRCKSRKIKCVDPNPGPCMYCASSGHECKITMQRKQRPFYYASEEQFRWLQIIAGKISPDADLSDISQLKEIAESLDGVKRESVDYTHGPEHTSHNAHSPINIEPEEGMEGVVDGIGTLMLDPLGRQKYVGESASVAFHRKVREYVQSQTPGGSLLAPRFPVRHAPTEPIDLVSPDEPIDVETPSGILGTSPRNYFCANPTSVRARLPPRQMADPLIDRFFKQVHSIFWVFPRDQFLRKLDKTYIFYDMDLYAAGTAPGFDERDRREIEEPNWMCCLFTVLSLGCSTDDNNGTHEILKPSHFFAYAKALSRSVVEDECLQSIQALLLMSLYLANTDLRSLGWIFLGDAIRMAQAHGLHRNDAALQYSDIVERETRRRLWWTLYEFERQPHLMRFWSMAHGHPASIHDNDSDTALPSESLLSPGDYTPIGYLASSVSLAQISGHIFQGMYSVPPQGIPNARGSRLSRRTIADLYGELVRWRHDVHPHLRINPNTTEESMNPSVMRALAFLDLRFQYAIISVTRPLLFRLVSGVRDGSFNALSTESRTFITTYSDACAQSARSSLLTLKFMHQNHLLNSVLWLDAFYILSTTMVLLLEFLRASSKTEAHRVSECISILRHLQPRGTGRIVLESLSDLSTFLGLDDLPPQKSPSQEPGQTVVGELQLYELFTNTPSSATTPGTGISSPEISVNGGMGLGFGVGGFNMAGGDTNGGPNEFAWMDQVVRMAYGDFGPS